jgi:hypothetical protein
MKRSTDKAGTVRPGTVRPGVRDLFGKRSRAALAPDAKTRMLALDLRAMSERAFHAGLGRSSSLIEIAALMVELEGAAIAQDELDL